MNHCVSKESRTSLKDKSTKETNLSTLLTQYLTMDWMLKKLNNSELFLVDFFFIVVGKRHS